MELPLGLQGSQFLLAVALGLLYGLHYDLLRGLRRSARRLTHLLDLWFVLSCLLCNLLFALYVGNGEYRIFMFLGTALGLTLWFLTLSRPILRVSAAFWRFLTFPIRRFCRIIRKILEKFLKNVKKLFSTAKKSVTIKRQSSKTKHSQPAEDSNYAHVQIVTHYKASDPGDPDLRDRNNRHASAKNQRTQRRKSAALRRN